MKTIVLNNGIEMPLIGYGVYQIPTFQTKYKVLDALEIGYRLIDTAQYYGNESGVGDAIQISPVSRNNIFITTKVMSNKNVEQSIDESLRKLKTDYIDLVLIHWVMGKDIETYHVLEKCVEKGKIRAIGLSNFYDMDYKNIVDNCHILPAISQQETHVFNQNNNLQELYKKTGTHLEAWAPFGEGKENIFSNPILFSIAKKYNKTVAQIILRFFIQKNIIVIPKSSHKERMLENFLVFDFNLNEEDIKTIETMDEKRSLFGWY